MTEGGQWRASNSSILFTVGIVAVGKSSICVNETAPELGPAQSSSRPDLRHVPQPPRPAAAPSPVNPSEGAGELSIRAGINQLREEFFGVLGCFQGMPAHGRPYPVGDHSPLPYGCLGTGTSPVGLFSVGLSLPYGCLGTGLFPMSGNFLDRKSPLQHRLSPHGGVPTATVDPFFLMH